MDPERFDNFARMLTNPRTRRTVLTALLGASLGLNGLSEPAATKKRKKKERPKPDPNRPDSCALQPYTGPGIDLGDAIDQLSDQRPDRHLVDVDFFDTLDKVGGCAASFDLVVNVNSAYRNFSPSVAGDNSPHTAGHAIDFSIQYDPANPSKRCSWDSPTHSGCLGTDPPTRVNPPTPKNREYAVDPVDWSDDQGGHGILVPGDPDATRRIQDFIRCVRDTGVRWGGDFKPAFDKKGRPVGNGYGKQQGFDPFHFDDGINQCGKNEACKERFSETKKDMQQASSQLHGDPRDWENWGSCPDGKECNRATGRCEDGCDPACPDDRECRDQKCECRAELTECDGKCVDALANDKHCNGCGKDCTTENKKCCDGACKDTKSDLDHCGGCGEICGADGCCDSTCTDLQNTDQHCGRCGNDCTEEECGMCAEGTCASCADGETEGYECCKGKCRSECADGKVRNPETCDCGDPDCIDDDDCGDPCRVCVENRCRPKTCGECQVCDAGACVPKPAETGACTGSNGSCYTTPGRCGVNGGCYCRQAAAGSGKCGNVCVGYLYTCRRTCAECPSGFRNCIRMGCCQSNGEQWVGCASSCQNP